MIGLTGFALFLYLLIHIAGNLLIFFGPTVFNNYAYVMEDRNPLLPIIEIALLLVFLIHIYKTVSMYIGNQQARPVALRDEEVRRQAQSKDLRVLDDDHLGLVAGGLPPHSRQGVQVQSRVSMAHRRTRSVPPGDGKLLEPALVGFYVLSMLVVGSHLWHGVSSAFQSLGFDHPTWTPRVLAGGKVFAAASPAASS